MKILNERDLTGGIDSFFIMLNGMHESQDDEKKVEAMFNAFDSDGTMGLDMEELTRGLLSLGGGAITTKQAQAFLQYLVQFQVSSCVSYLVI